MTNPKQLSDELERLLRGHLENLRSFAKKVNKELGGQNSPAFELKANLIGLALREALSTKTRITELVDTPVIYVAHNKDKTA